GRSADGTGRDPEPQGRRRAGWRCRRAHVEPRPVQTGRVSDTLAYFVPEALGHLEVVSRCLLALEQGRDVEDNAGSLYRAVHTLKGAAYVVGQTRVGDLAHRIEDILAAGRTRARLPPPPLHPAHPRS